MSREYGPPRRSLADALGSIVSATAPRAIDAFVVATSLQFDAAVIATGDPDDIRRLASPLRHVRVFAL